MKHTRQYLEAALLAVILMSMMQGCTTGPSPYEQTDRETREVGYVYLDQGHFKIDGQEWFPLMLNYKVDVRQAGTNIVIEPIEYYETGTMEEHFDSIASWGFNSIRVCCNWKTEATVDSGLLYAATDTMLRCAERHGLKVMMLIDEKMREYDEGLLRHCAGERVLWCYDMMNEPLYFDTAAQRSKEEAYQIVCGWREKMEQNAPHQLFTIAFAEPIEVFEWDPALLPVDFIEMHTYHPLRVGSEMYWYGHYCGKPWMVGETALPADGDSVGYEWQERFMEESFACAIGNGAIGYGWWEFGDCPGGPNFEGQYTGLRRIDGQSKPATKHVRNLMARQSQIQKTSTPPENYYNMVGYRNIVLHGRIVDADDGTPIEGAVVRGWNDDWSVGMNTYTTKDGTFALYSNDYCVHFEVSAPKREKLKFDRYDIGYQTSGGDATESVTLDDRTLEYQQIGWQDYVRGNRIMQFVPGLFDQAKIEGKMGELRLGELGRRQRWYDGIIRWLKRE